jgi:hypothetical protein
LLSKKDKVTLRPKKKIEGSSHRPLRLAILTGGSSEETALPMEGTRRKEKSTLSKSLELNSRWHRKKCSCLGRRVRKHLWRRKESRKDHYHRVGWSGERWEEVVILRQVSISLSLSSSLE